MKLEKIITLANAKVRLRFLAMERSLRATGCDLPLWVIPYDNHRFDLPPNAVWWEVPEIRPWLEKEGAHPMMGKYQCLATAAYQYVDTDVIFLRDPAATLAPESGFITSCGHWHNPGDAISPASLPLLRQASTCWQADVFNAGQFACDRTLYTAEQLRATCLDRRYIETCLRFRFHDQPGLVLLVHLAGVPIRNLTLPPRRMESTWAGDYADENYARYWTPDSRRPYLIHWAGCSMATGRPIDRLFTDYLTAEERGEWRHEIAAKARADELSRRSPRHVLRRFARAGRAFLRELQCEF